MDYGLSTTTALLLTILGVICWGSWANTYRGCQGWRFEYYYFSYSICIFLGMIIISGIFGKLDLSDKEIIFSAGTLWAILSGMIFNIGNILLVVSIILAGFAVAFPLGIGLGLFLGTIMAHLTSPASTAHPNYLFAGLFFIMLAVIINSFCYHFRERALKIRAVNNFRRGLCVSVIAGIFIGSYPFLFNFAFQEGLNSYRIAVTMTGGALLCSFIILPILARNPLVPNQQPTKFFQHYPAGRWQWYFWAITGGIVWCIGLIANLTASAHPDLSVAIAFTLGRCTPLVAALWGIFVWKEFKDCPGKIYIYLGAMFMLFIFGLYLVANARA